VVTGGRAVGEIMVSHRAPRKIAFTGSIPGGKAIAAAATGTMKRLTLELGGQSPAIICADADLDKAAAAICRHAFANSGQFCYRVARIYVERGAYDSFATRLLKEVEALTVAPAGGTGDLGPLANQKIFDNSIRHIDDALSKGAKLLCGGQRLSGAGFDGGYYLPPTLLSHCPPNSLIMTEETFGPVLAVAAVDTAEEAVSISNSSPFGLAAFVFSSDVNRGRALCGALEAGSVWLNNIQRSSHHVPFGGMKESGLGREKGRFGIEAYLEWKTIYLNEVA
jgi:succinate-semialdehyde dehydrogenase / glutarate-semialdehyde dehydrogenase